MTALATQQPTALSLFSGLAPSKYNDADFDKVASAGSYLPRLTQFTDASAQVKRRELTIGYYIVVGKDDRVPLGEEIEVVPIAWRFKALDTSVSPPVSSLDPESEVFKAIASRSGAQNSNCQAGIEYLVWIPAAEKFATYLMGSKTAKREAAKLKSFIGCAATLKTHTYENDKFVWQGPKVYESSVPPAALPSPESLKDTVEKFNNPDLEDGPKAEVVEDSKPKRAR